MNEVFSNQRSIDMCVDNISEHSNTPKFLAEFIYNFQHYIYGTERLQLKFSTQQLYVT